jgi:WD40 repeat protein
MGVSGRPDLFTARIPPPQQVITSQSAEVEDVHIREEQSQPLQLERVIGYNPLPRGLQCHPLGGDLFVKSMGSLVVIESTNDIHFQNVMRAHDMSVSALDLSPSGQLCASGQEGSQHVKGFSAPIFVWHLPTGKRISVLKGLTSRVNVVSFSPDEKMLFAAGEDGMYLIWDLSTSEVVCGNRTLVPISVMLWLDRRVENRDVVYRICFGVGGQLSLGSLFFQRSRMQWELCVDLFGMPPSAGIIRVFRAIAISEDCSSVYIGTSGGEVLVFKVSSRVYRSCVSVCTNGVNAVVLLGPDLLLVGGGDGNICLLRGIEANLSKLREASLEAGVVSLSLSASRAEALVGLASGRTYLCRLDDLACSLVGESPVESVCSSCMSSSALNETCFLTGGTGGEIRVWDLVDNACLSIVRISRAGPVNALVAIDFNGNQCVIAAFEDGSVRCFDRRSLRSLWSIPEAHKRGTKCISANADEAGASFMVSGGGDGVVRVWLLRNRELITQFNEHRKELCAVLVDRERPSVVHSAAVDGAVISFDLRAGRRLISHSVISGSALTCMAQRLDSEREVLVCDNRGRTFHLDIDVRDPVGVFQDPSRSALLCCALSPSGLFLATAGDDTVLRIVLLQTGETVCAVKGHSASVRSLMWTSDGRQLVSTGDDTCICIWNFYLNT